jgi:hypothetical protein
MWRCAALDPNLSHASALAQIAKAAKLAPLDLPVRKSRTARIIEMKEAGRHP